MLSAGRSLTEPAGLLPSNLTKIVLLVFPGKRWSRTNGVLPTKDSIVGKIVSPETVLSVEFIKYCSY